MPTGLRALAAAAAGAVLAAGCSPTAPPRGRIHGTVTLDGKPLPTGQIRIAALSNGGIGTYGPVADGRYDIPADRGPTTGKYRIEVSSEQRTGKKVLDRDAGTKDVVDELAETLPAKFNTESTLMIDYDSAAPKSYDFDLKK